jgi:hypothetical protein
LSADPENKKPKVVLKLTQLCDYWQDVIENKKDYSTFTFTVNKKEVESLHLEEDDTVIFFDKLFRQVAEGN